MCEDMNKKTLKKLVEILADTREDEIGCTECYDHLDAFVEKYLQGADPAEIMPMVRHHLKMCSCCYEEFKGLIEALGGTMPSL
jgi:hypothetical protein